MITLLLSVSCTLSIMAQKAPPTETPQKKETVGTFTHSMAIGTGAVSQSVALGDLDGDGDLDAMVANYDTPNTVWTNDSDSINDCPADFDGDGVVNGRDLTIFLNAWGSSNDIADFNDDGQVDGHDLEVILAAWGPCGE